MSADEAERALPPAAIRLLNEALGGWCTFGIDTAPEAYLAAAQRAFRADKIKAPRRAPALNRKSSTSVKVGPFLAGLPAKTLHYISQTRPDPKYQPEGVYSPPPVLPYDMHVLLVPDAERVWIVTSRSEKLAVARAKALLAPSPALSWPELGKLAGQPGLGFFAVDFVAFDALNVEWDSLAQRKLARGKLQSSIITSGKARDLVPFWLDVVPRRGEPGHTLRLRTEFPLLRVLGDLAVDLPMHD